MYSITLIHLNNFLILNTILNFGNWLLVLLISTFIHFINLATASIPVLVSPSWLTAFLSLDRLCLDSFHCKYTPHWSIIDYSTRTTQWVQKSDLICIRSISNWSWLSLKIIIILNVKFILNEIISIFDYNWWIWLFIFLIIY